MNVEIGEELTFVLSELLDDRLADEELGVHPQDRGGDENRRQDSPNALRNNRFKWIGDCLDASVDLTKRQEEEASALGMVREEKGGWQRLVVPRGGFSSIQLSFSLRSSPSHLLLLL